MRVVARQWFLGALLLVAGLVILGGMLASRDRGERSQVVSTMTSIPEKVRQSSERTSDSAAPATSNNGVVSPQAGTFRGRVVDAATKAPIREFKIEFFDRYAAMPTPGARVFQTKDGRFEWPNIPAKVWQITASAAGYQRFDMGEVLIRTDVAMPEVVLPLRRGFRVTGRVFDEFTRAGIENATVSFRDAQLAAYDGNWRRRERTSTDRDGAFVLEGVPAGRITVSASGSNEHADKAVTIFVAPDLPPLQIGLSAGGLVSGRLTASDRATGVAGHVGLFDVDRGFGGYAPTERNGEFIYKNLSPGRYLLTGRSDLGQVESEFTLAASERRENIVLALEAGTVIRGTITGLSAKELASTNISTHRDDNDFDFTTAKIDARGGYTLSALRPGRFRIIVDVSNKRQVARVVDVPSEGELIVDFNFARGARLSGRITRNGKPWPHVPVEPEPLVEANESFVYGTSSSQEGAYAFDNLPYGDYRFAIAGYRTAVVRIDADREFDIDVPAASSFEGRVSESASGVPIVGARVDLRAAEAGTKLVSRMTTTNHFGRFTVMGLQPGDYVVTIYKTEFEMYRERLSFSGAKAEREIRLPPDRGVSVRLRGPNGATPRTVETTELVAGNRVGGLVLRLDEEGTTYLPSGMAGSSLVLRVRGFEPVQVAAWDGRELDLRLTPRRERSGEDSP